MTTWKWAAAAALSAAVMSGAATAAAEDAKAAEVLAAARKAIGGKAASLDTLAVEAALQRNVGSVQMSSDVEILVDLPDKYLRADSPRGGMAGPLTMGFSGEKVIRPAGSSLGPGGAMMIRIGPGGPAPATEKLTPDEQARAEAALRRSAQADISRLMLGWLAAAHPALGATYTYAGEAESPDGKAHVIDVTAPEGFAARLFIDQQTQLPLMVTFQAVQPRVVRMEGPRGGRGQGRGAPADELRKLEEETAPPALVENTLFFDDWRDVGGLRFPHSIRRAAGGTTNEEWTVNRVRVNPKIDPRKFHG